MMVPEDNNVIVYDALQTLQNLCMKDINSVPETLLDIMRDKKKSAQDRIQAAGMYTYIATFNTGSSMFTEPQFKIQLVGKGSRNGSRS